MYQCSFSGQRSSGLSRFSPSRTRCCGLKNCATWGFRVVDRCLPGTVNRKLFYHIKSCSKFHVRGPRGFSLINRDWREVVNLIWRVFTSSGTRGWVFPTTPAPVLRGTPRPAGPRPLASRKALCSGLWAM